MRNRSCGVRESLVVTTALLLVLAACSGDEESVETSSTTSTNAPPMTAAGTSAPLEPSTTTTTTTTNAPAPAFAGIGETVLVTSDDGVYQIGPEGDVELLVAGPVAYAVDDTQGGLLFQVNRGRWDDVDPWSSIVWWIPRGASRPQELLVPTPGAGHQLSLHDSYAIAEGFAVLYTRHESGGDADFEWIDRLRRFEVPARQVTDLYSQRAWEAGFNQVSANAELIAGVWYQQVGSGCFIHDLDGQPTDLVPEEASDPTSEDYVRGCRLSPTGDQLIFLTEQSDDNELVTTTLHGWDLTADAEVTRVAIPGSYGRLTVLNVSATKAVASFINESGQRIQTLGFDLEAPEADPVVLPITGRARFVDTPVQIGGPIHVGRGPDYYRYGDDGLYRVVDGVETQLSGDSVFWVYDDLMGGVVYRHSYDESRDVLWLGANADEPESLSVTGVWDAALVDGQPMLLVSAADPEGKLCPDYDFGGPAMLHDLATGDQTFLHCHEEGPDGGLSSYGTSLGADMLVSVEWVMSTDRRIVFQDLSGQEVTVDINPVAEPCLPCHLSVEISDDGALLAYSMWPTGFSPLPDDDHESAYETWRAAAETIPVEVAVLDLASGRQLWHMALDPGIRLTDFDGRYLVVGPDFGMTGSVIYDTWSIHESVEVDGGAALIRQSVTHATEITLGPDGLGVASFGEPADEALNTMTSLLGPPVSEEFIDPFAEQVALPYGFAANRYFRLSRWDHIGLYLVFSDSNYFREDGEPHFIGWGATQPGLQTEAGIGVGSTADELVAAHGDAVDLPDSFLSECDQGWAFRIAPPDPPEIPDYHASMRGELDGDPQDPTTRITGLRGGADSDC